MKHFCSFSEAIREGIPQSSQAFGRATDHNGGRCVLETARRAMDVGHYHDVVDDYPYLLAVVDCPARECKFHAPIKDRNFKEMGVLVHLNDAHRWSREQIADWLESEEEKLGYVTISES